MVLEGVETLEGVGLGVGGALAGVAAAEGGGLGAFCSLSDASWANLMASSSFWASKASSSCIKIRVHGQ